MLEFDVASQAQVDEEGGEEKLVEFSVAGLKFWAKRPTPGQTNILLSSRRRDATGVIWRIFENILVANEPETPIEQRHGEYDDLRQLVFDGAVPVALLFGGDELNGRGILDSIIREFAGYPTQPSEDSSPSPSSGGKKSTGRSPGKGSTASTSD